MAVVIPLWNWSLREPESGVFPIALLVGNDDDYDDWSDDGDDYSDGDDVRNDDDN